MNELTQVASRYRIDRRLGIGGMATVYLAFDIELERWVALKLISDHLADEPLFVLRFRHEAQAAAKLAHHNIVQVFDFGRDSETERHYIVMEYVDGCSCQQLLARDGLVEVDRTVKIICDVCRGLSYAHHAGVLHRDVKPGNLLVSEQTGAAKLADFGIAKAAERTQITEVGSVIGTAAYLSPEQARGESLGPASDIYSLGVCAYQLLTGHLTYECESLSQLVLRQQHEFVAPARAHRPDVPEGVDLAIQGCLAPDPTRRFTTAQQVADALTAGLAGAPSAQAGALVTRKMRQACATKNGSKARTRPLPVGGLRKVGLKRSFRPARLWAMPRPGVLVAAIVALFLAVGVGAMVAATGHQSPQGAVALVPGVAGIVDPSGDQEHPGVASKVVDGNPDTSWDTQHYTSSDFGGVKPGAGVYVQSSSAVAARAFSVLTPTPGWTGQVYAANAGFSSVGLSGWTAVSRPATINSQDAEFSLDTGGKSYRYYMLWLTRLPPGNHAEIAELKLLQ